MDEGETTALPAKRPKMSGAERQRKFKERQKRKDKTFQAKENVRVENTRKRRVSEMTDAELKKYRSAAASRQAKCRKLKKNAARAQESTDNCATPSSSRPYRCPQSLGKAIRKTLRSLPVSPRKKVAVISGLDSRVGVQLQQKMQKNVQNEDSSNLKTCIESFYFQSDISYTSPGLKDEMVTWIEGQKCHLRKHFLTMFLREAYSLFTSSNPDQLTSFSKFCALRPPNVLLLKQTPAEQCKCKTHENFRLKLKALSVTYDRDWWGDVLCYADSISSECWKGTCEVCCHGKRVPLEGDPAKRITWKEWASDKNTGRISLETKEGCAAQLHELLCTDFSFMLEHTRVKRIQASAFEEDKKNHCVMQVDFAMAYSCDYQNEIQSTLWSCQTVQLFTVAQFAHNKCNTFLICSNTTNKDKDTVYTFILQLYNILFQDESYKTDHVIYSDGPSSEVKNRFMVKLLYILAQKYQVDFEWKYFATSHGKGVVDEIGGKAKSLVRQKSMSQAGYIIQNHLIFAT